MPSAERYARYREKYKEWDKKAWERKKNNPEFKEYRREYYQKWAKENSERRREINYRSRKSIVGYKKSMFNRIKMRIKHDDRYKHRKLLFSFEEFNNFLESSNFLILFNQWKDSGHTLRLAPSVDRIENCKDYSLNNIQIITQSENSKKGAK